MTMKCTRPDKFLGLINLELVIYLVQLTCIHCLISLLVLFTFYGSCVRGGYIDAGV